LRERERKRECTGGGAERKEEGQADSMLSVELDLRAQSHDPEIMTGVEIRSWTLNRLSHPGTPIFVLMLND